jgi:hypothetical protein
MVLFWLGIGMNVLPQVDVPERLSPGTYLEGIAASTRKSIAPAPNEAMVDESQCEIP